MYRFGTGGRTLILLRSSGGISVSFTLASCEALTSSVVTKKKSQFQNSTLVRQLGNYSLMNCESVNGR